jgi:hypothetical protein
MDMFCLSKYNPVLSLLLLIIMFVASVTRLVPFFFWSRNWRSPLAFSGVHIAQSIVFCIVFCGSLYHVSFDLQFLIFL